MDISTYLNSADSSLIGLSEKPGRNRITDIVYIFNEEQGLPDLHEYNIAIIGVEDDRGTLSKGSDKAPDVVRRSFYSLFAHWKNLKIIDLGNIKKGHRIDDTYFALKEVVSELLKSNVVSIIIGGGQDLTYANYLAYENIGRVINIAAVDPLFDLGYNDHDLNSTSYLSHIILHQPNFLFNYTNIGFQTYYVDSDSLVLMKNLYFDTYRLGNVKANLEEVEPMVRDADILSIDLNSIKFSDAPASDKPNGFNGEEMCRIARYAGMADKLTSFGLYELSPELDDNGVASNLYAQMMWYFLDGMSKRRQDYPELESSDYTKFNVQVDGFDEDLIFLKSKKTGRWWMIVSSKDAVSKKYIRQQYVSCSYDDYQTALNHELPDRWWKVQQKLM